MNIPDTLKYSEEHEWVRTEGGDAVTGITDFAQHELTDIVFVELPAVGAELQKGGAMAVVESVKAVSDVYSPLTGTVAAVNSRLVDEPELVNNDPYGDGWMVRIKPAAPEEIDELMSAGQYKQHINAE